MHVFAQAELFGGAVPGEGMDGGGGGVEWGGEEGEASALPEGWHEQYDSEEDDYYYYQLGADGYEIEESKTWDRPVREFAFRGNASLVLILGLACCQGGSGGEAAQGAGDGASQASQPAREA